MQRDLSNIGLQLNITQKDGCQKNFTVDFHPHGGVRMRAEMTVLSGRPKATSTYFRPVSKNRNLNWAVKVSKIHIITPYMRRKKSAHKENSRKKYF